VVWKILFPVQRTVLLPHQFNAQTMQKFVGQVVDEQRDARCSEIVFDFSRVDFIEPVGVVVLSNLIEYFRRMRCTVKCANHARRTEATKFLDDSLFFERYLKKRLFADCATRSTTMPLRLVGEGEASQYLRFTLMPWIAKSVGMPTDSIDGVRTALEEVLHNVADHSGVGIGCTFAQHFPKRNRIQVAISDFGAGIPSVVRTKVANIKDPAALRQACEEGFTTKSNVANRGAGLTNLIRYVTTKNAGNVLIAAGKAELSASPISRGAAPFKITTRDAGGFYPGTLVRVILRTDYLDESAVDLEPETFTW
jgi:anti-sigma regulatory factor (Ser/Thr protein kinase)/anti-anti-sigma regulatory factor